MCVLYGRESDLNGLDYFPSDEALQECHEKPLIVLTRPIVKLEEEMGRNSSFNVVYFVDQAIYRVNYMIGSLRMFIYHSNQTQFVCCTMA